MFNKNRYHETIHSLPIHKSGHNLNPVHMSLRLSNYTTVLEAGQVCPRSRSQRACPRPFWRAVRAFAVSAQFPGAAPAIWPRPLFRQRTWLSGGFLLRSIRVAGRIERRPEWCRAVVALGRSGGHAGYSDLDKPSRRGLGTSYQRRFDRRVRRGSGTQRRASGRRGDRTFR